VTLATGQKVTQEDEVSGWTAAKGGIMPKGAAAKDRDRDRSGEESLIKGLSNQFQGTQDIDWQDAEMKRCVVPHPSLTAAVPIFLVRLSG
jgi:hypothetical protein